MLALVRGTRLADKTARQSVGSAVVPQQGFLQCAAAAAAGHECGLLDVMGKGVMADHSWAPVWVTDLAAAADYGMDSDARRHESMFVTSLSNLVCVAAAATSRSTTTRSRRQGRSSPSRGCMQQTRARQQQSRSTPSQVR